MIALVTLTLWLALDVAVALFLGPWLKHRRQQDTWRAS